MHLRRCVFLMHNWHVTGIFFIYKMLETHANISILLSGVGEAYASEPMWWVVHFERIFNVTREELVVSGSDSFSRACATSYRFFTELVNLFLTLRVFWVVSFITWQPHKLNLCQSEPERELISSSLESLGWVVRHHMKPHKLVTTYNSLK